MEWEVESSELLGLRGGDADGAFTGALVPRWRSTGLTRCFWGLAEAKERTQRSAAR